MGTAPTTLIPTATNWDGTHFVGIVGNRYSYDPQRRSNVAFFPLYPLLAAGLALVCRLSIADALFIVSNSALCGAVVVFAMYLSTHHAHADSYRSCLFSGLCLLLYPTTMFHRVCYSDSLMLFLALLTLFGIHRRWWLPGVAALVGLATAARSVGIALLLPFALYLWDESRHWRDFVARGIILFPLACWGLIAYMLFLYLEFGDPLAFAKTQQHWWQRTPESLSQYLVAVATLEPIWSVYDPDSVAYWGRGIIKNPLFSLRFANPIYFVLTVGLVAYGGWKQWLDTKELLLGAGLLLIPYAVHSYQTCFVAQGRYSAVVFPAYLVMGRILARCHWIVWVLFFGCCAFWMEAYSAYFAAWYDII